MRRWHRSARNRIPCAPPHALLPSERPDRSNVARKILARQIMPIRLARLHARLLISIAVGAAVTLGLSMTDWSMATKLLLGWDIGVVLYLALVYQLMIACGIDEIRRRAAEDDEGAIALLVLTGISGL